MLNIRALNHDVNQKDYKLHIVTVVIACLLVI
jgi:hypothetical protein